MQVSVDRDRCCSSGMCVMNAPDIFEQDDQDSLVRLRQTEFEPAQFAVLRLAADLCPGGAISVTEEDAVEAAPAKDAG
ncbi:ferredoxin [Kitasatospora sp. MAA19]|uniref:ferredoxin n=1 Tax=unclassified Kitasatospora TaxID=2633591 RepID=UPI002475CFB3|nr:ferredoxin [Kitasatospora sp. MAA19]MDH6708935.1 ferredoxin [Kitasatospora sp. MAA19]